MNTSDNTKSSMFPDIDKRHKDDVIFLNQRSTPRVSAELEVTISGPHNFFSGFTEDISQGGVFIATHQVYPIGTEFSIALKLEGNELSLDAKVVWVRDNTPFLPEGVEPGMGLCFTNINNDSLKLIQDFIKKKEPIFFDADL